MRYIELVVQSNVSFGDFSSFTTGASFSPLGENCRALSVRWKKRDKRKRLFAYCLWVASEGSPDVRRGVRAELW